LKRAGSIVGSVIGIIFACALLFAGAYAALWGYTFRVEHSRGTPVMIGGILVALLCLWAATGLLTHASRGLRQALDANQDTNQSDEDMRVQ
jgi:hypothetical protein